MEPGQRYYYAVSSVDIFDVESSLSPFAGFSTSRPSLLAPSQVSARSITGRAEVRWNRTRQPGAAGYTVYRRTRDQELPVAIGTLPVDETMFIDADATAGTLYWYSVSVITDEDESPRSLEQSLTIRE